MTERYEREVLSAAPGTRADLELRIALLEDDVDYLYRVVRLAGLRREELEAEPGGTGETSRRDHLDLGELTRLLSTLPKTRN